MKHEFEDEARNIVNQALVKEGIECEFDYTLKVLLMNVVTTALETGYLKGYCDGKDEIQN